MAQCPGAPEITNYFQIPEYQGKCEFFGTNAPLPQSVGYGVTIAFGAFFSVLTSVIVYFSERIQRKRMDSEEFTTAGRNIKAGFISVIIVSHWTWSTTVLQSSVVAYKWGVSGAFWYGTGNSITIYVMAQLCAHLKRKAPKAHTILEVIKLRWGSGAHITFMFYTLATNTLSTVNMILGGAAAVTALTGMSIYASSLLIPVGVIVYTALGGLRATFIADYIHTVYVYVMLILFMFFVYGNAHAGPNQLGNPGDVWQRLTTIANIHPVAGNYKGSYVTMLSKEGFTFGVISFLTYASGVLADQGYWQSGIAAAPSNVFAGFIIGGLSWFTIPFGMGTSLGLAVRALDLPLTLKEVNSGLVIPAAAQHLMGTSGAILIFILMLMTMTSAGSGEQIAVSSLLTYDVWKEYVVKKASKKQLLLMARIFVALYGVWSGVLSIIFHVIGLDLNWVYYFQGVVVGSSVPPIFLSLTWRKCTSEAAISGALVGMFCSLATWLGTAKGLYGNVSIEATENTMPSLVGNVINISVSAIVCVVVSLIQNKDFNWEDLGGTKLPDDQRSAKEIEQEKFEQEGLVKATKFYTWFSWGVVALLVVIWPGLSFPAKVFPKHYFGFWSSISIFLALVAAIVNIIFPIVEARKVFFQLPSVFLDIFRKRKDKLFVIHDHGTKNDHGTKIDRKDQNQKQRTEANANNNNNNNPSQ